MLARLRWTAWLGAGMGFPRANIDGTRMGRGVELAGSRGCAKSGFRNCGMRTPGANSQRNGVTPRRDEDELMGGVCASLNRWPGNRGTAWLKQCHEKYGCNSGAHDSRERPAPNGKSDRLAEDKQEG